MIAEEKVSMYDSLKGKDNLIKKTNLNKVFIYNVAWDWVLKTETVLTWEWRIGSTPLGSCCNPMSRRFCWTVFLSSQAFLIWALQNIMSTQISIGIRADVSGTFSTITVFCQFNWNKCSVTEHQEFPLKTPFPCSRWPLLVVVRTRCVLAMCPWIRMESHKLCNVTLI